MKRPLCDGPPTEANSYAREIHKTIYYKLLQLFAVKGTTGIRLTGARFIITVMAGDLIDAAEIIHSCIQTPFQHTH